ncbi:MAG: cytochrome c [Phycisphaeraceae bacterium]
MNEQHETTERESHRRPTPVPRLLVHLLVIGVVATWVPFAWIALSRASLKRNPPPHLFQDMMVQPKLTAQAASPLFADGRAMRPQLAGTIARGDLRADDFLHRGYATDDNGHAIEVPVPGAANNTKDRKWFSGYPAQVKVTPELVARGQQRFNIYCAPCHGQSGEGNGITNIRAQKLNTEGWVQPSNIVGIDAQGRSVYGEELYPGGKLFNTITHGIRTMPGYGAQISPADRWAIVAYVRALQLSRNGRVDQLTNDQREKLR